MTLIALDNASMHAIKNRYTILFLLIQSCVNLITYSVSLPFKTLGMGPILYSTLRVLDLQFLHIWIKFVALSELRLSWYP